MTSPNANADAQAVANKLDGIDGSGNSEPFREVAMLYEATMFGLGIDYRWAENGNVSSSALDHIATLAKVLTRKHTHIDGNQYDLWDAVNTILHYVLMQNEAINNSEPHSVNHKAAQ